VTGYDELDQRIARTKADKTYLLMALEHPEVPLHNNPAELDAWFFVDIYLTAPVY
jgi:hypothetical protein